MKIAIYSPETCGNVGHGLIYASQLLKHLQQDFQICFFTLKKIGCSDQFEDYKIHLTSSSLFNSTIFHKKRYLRFGIFSGLVFGLLRVYYHYRLLKQFYRTNQNVELFHLFEFEYISASVYLLFHRKLLSKTILGFHSADFSWIPGRPVIVNLYKSLLKPFLSRLVQKSHRATVHGLYLKEELVKNLSLKKNASNVNSIPYGCKEIIPIDKSMARWQLGLESDHFYALFFGVMREDKGILEILQNFDLIDENIYLIVAGSEGDVSEESITSIVRGLKTKDRIILNIKYLSEDEIALYYFAADLILLPHKKYHVAFSGPLSLAVEHQRPVLASDIGEIGLFVKKYSLGNTFTCEDWQEFSSSLNSIYPLLLAGGDKVDFGKCIRENSWKSMAERIADIYTSAE